MDITLCSNDGSIVAGSDCRALDFTLGFEQAILNILPNVLFVILSLSTLARWIATTLRRPRQDKVTSLRSHLRSYVDPVIYTRWDGFLVAKAGVGVMLVGVKAIGAGLIRRTTELRAIGTSVPAEVVSSIASALLLTYIIIVHYAYVSPSTITCLFALWQTLVTGTQIRTYGLIGVGKTDKVLYGTACVAAGLSGMLCVLEMVGRRRLFKAEYRAIPLRQTTSFALKPFFLHLIPLLRTGGRRKLTLDDLDQVPPHLLAEPALNRMDAGLRGGDQTRKTYLLSATFKAFGRDMFAPVLPRFLLLLATYGQVFLVQDMTTYVDDRKISHDRGWALVGGFVLIYTIIPITTYLYWEAVFNISVQYRSGLVGSIYAKTLRLASTRKIGQGAAATYMSVDVERVVTCLAVIHELWAAVVSIVLACVLLWFQASYAMFAPLATISLLLAITSVFSGPSGRSQSKWMAAIDERIKLLSSMFSQILPIKLGAHEDVFLAKATALRNKETMILRKFYILIFSVATISNVGSVFAGLTCISCYYVLHVNSVKGAEGDLTISRIFTILTIVNLLSGPINTLGQSLPDVAAAFVSLKRIGGFLVMPEKQGAVSVAQGLDEGPRPPPVTDKLELDQITEQPKELDVIRITDGTFGWERDVPVLHDINLALEPGKLTILVGPVASGKSSLLSTILGETTLLDGQIVLPVSKVAYASQTPFIFPGTIRSNIVFDQPFDANRMKIAVEACGLTRDLQRLTHGLETKLGDRGVTLSGGQRQRVALARAVYSAAGTVILDDTFSALDGETEAHVFRALFGASGLLKDRTVLLVTHGRHHLQHAERIISLQEGRIVYDGPYSDMEDRQDTTDHNAAVPFSTVPTVGLTQQSDPEKSPEEEDEEDDEAEGKSSNWGAYAFYFQSMGLFTAVLSLGLVMMTNAASVGIQGFLKAFASADGHTPQWLGGYAGICFVFVISQSIALTYWSFYTIPRSCQVVHQRELEGVLRAHVSYLQLVPAGKILNRFSQDIQENDFEFPLALLNFVYGISSLVGSMIFFILATPWLALAIPILAPIYWFILHFYLKTSKQLQHLEAGSKSPLYTLFSTTIAGLTCIRSYKAERYFADQNSTFLDRSQGPFFFRFEGQIFLRVVLSWMTAVLAIGMGVISVALRDKTSAAFLGVALSQLTSFGTQLANALSAYARVENGAVSIKRIQEFVDLPKEETALAKQAITIGTKPSDVTWPASGALLFEDYSMQYKEGLPPALKHLSFSLDGGQKIGICGRSGSGKSSMLLALFRATKLNTGFIKIDGTDIAQIPLQQLRGAMSIVTQDPFLWHGTVRDNIDVESTCSDEEIWIALEDVGMRKAISELPDTLEHLVDDEESFSKGQRQLLCLARALLSKRRIIVLDESTSSMDHASDEMIRQVIETKMKGRTVLAIAHRISSIVHYDRILLLEDGELKEHDTPQNLLADPSSRFAKLAATQGITAEDKPS